MNIPALTHPVTRLESAYECMLRAGGMTPAPRLRRLILEIDLVAASFGLLADPRDEIDGPDEALPMELVLAAAVFTQIPVDLQPDLAGDLEEALARHCPIAAVAHFVRVKLWMIDQPEWARLMGLVLNHVTNEEACKAITAVIVNHVGHDHTGDNVHS